MLAWESVGLTSDSARRPGCPRAQSEVEATLQRINNHKVRDGAGLGRLATLPPAGETRALRGVARERPSRPAGGTRTHAGAPSSPPAQGVLCTIIVNEEGAPVRTTADASVTQQYAELIPQLASMARSLVRDLDPQNDLQFLRIRSKMHEIMVYSDKEFTLIVVQDPSAQDPVA